ncbi:MAG: DNA replication/repair protein RecF [Hydrogenophaga sp.]|uniref:DNA replication/repair protein RecF n=1 Tax=Hydrogenophaga sp. TaxID=1904254 RepID=UPI0027305A8B|nr:DNA replication/repair protein RecF [Hydrogenophaga sp.]MDP2166609.1 DNA replication/repair protein RecF [Hydrogenophaga sp.]
MSVVRLEITHLRNLQSVSLLPHPRLNLLAGANGSGKTSVLEALHLLGLGRSFRSGRARRLVNDAETACTVFAGFEDGGTAGIRRGANGETDLKVDNSSQVTLAQLVHRLPLCLLDPESMDLLDAGSKPRRAQLDWGVFHVEHRFYPVWLRYQRALKQRNSLLRSGSIGRLESAVWDRELADSALQLHQFRVDYLARWQPLWEGRMQGFLPDQSLTLDYTAGWDVSLPLEQLLAESWERDLDKGHTQIGPHRADLRVKRGTAPADEVLSRGQKKLVVCALKLSQVALLQEAGRECVLLVDDLASELDATARQRLIDYLAASGAQVFITCIEPEAVKPALEGAEQGFRMFHVEHGTITEVS